MKNRTIPFGYVYESAKVVINKKESETVFKIFKSYLNGKSLSLIAEELNNQKTEYMPGIIGWNKARLKHILDDDRYIGVKGFPKIIDEQDYNKVRSLKTDKSPMKNQDAGSKKYWSRVPVLCAQCREVMQRKCNNRLRRKVKWYCRNGHSVFIDDDAILAQISNCLRGVAGNVEQVKGCGRKIERVTENESKKTSRITGEDKEEIKKHLLQQASQKYRLLEESGYKEHRLKDMFTDMGISDSFPGELFERAADAVLLEEDGTVGIILINGQEIR